MNRDEIRKLLQQNPEAVIDLIEKLFARIEELERRLNMNSQNSNKPPSSDGLNRRERRAQQRKSRKKRGGQKGHEGNQLKMSAKPDRTEVHRVTKCHKCNCSLDGIQAKGYRKRQVFDIPPVSLEVTEHQVEYKACPHCGAVTEAQFPEGVTRPAQYGSRIKGFITYLSQYQLIPYERVTELLEDLFGVQISTGTIYNTNRQAFEAGAIPEEAIKNCLKKQPLLHADETGVFIGGSLHWLHVLSNEKYTYYYPHKKRGKEALEEMGIIPGYCGYLMHDFFSSYLSYDCSHVFCNAHILRELTGIYEDYKQKWALEMIDLLTRVKKQVEERTLYLKKTTIKKLEDEYDRILLKGFRCNPPAGMDTSRRGRKKKSKPRNLLERLRQHKEGIIGFVKDFAIPFDNNQAERDLRMVKVQQKISGCFRSVEGGMFFARIRGYISTVKKHNENVLIALQGLFENK
ncbi:MAG: IS66 family transposase, partial [Anaerolinea sp.]